MRPQTRLISSLLALLTLSLTHHAHAGGITCMRRSGPPALAALMAEHAEAIQLHREGKPVANWDQISSTLDTVAAQRDAWASGLYWYTNLDEAKAAAKRENKPIVSLRMLGRQTGNWPGQDIAQHSAPGFEEERVALGRIDKRRERFPLDSTAMRMRIPRQHRGARAIAEQARADQHAGIVVEIHRGAAHFDADGEHVTA